MKQKGNFSLKLKKYLSILVIASMTIMSLPLTAGTASAETAPQSLITDYLPTITETIDASGFKHPGIGLTKETLEHVQTQVRANKEPWKTYFNQMATSTDPWGGQLATKTVSPRLKGSCSNAGCKEPFVWDGLIAYTQALMYLITGDEAYRANTMLIIRNWEKMNPANFTYFTDSHIHMGVPLYRMVTAAEIMRSTSTQTPELAWTDKDTADFTNNVIVPVNETYNHTNFRFMNQHLYPLIGAISGYIFTGNVEGYREAVEWFTVNKTAVDQHMNGSIKRLFRLVDTDASTGEKVANPQVQLVEMGRDQAHATGDVINVSILSRLLQAQGTKVDPVEGTVSTEENAVTTYDFLGKSILAGTDYFARYMIGYDTPWIPTEASVRYDGSPVIYQVLADGYHGRIGGDAYDLYYYYKYEQGLNMEQVAPYYTEMFKKRINYNWASRDAGGEYWLYIPKEAEAEGTANLPKMDPNPNWKEVEYRFTNLDGNSEAMQEGDDSFVRIKATESGSRMALVQSDNGTRVIGYKIRTNGAAKLEAFGETITLPDTQGQWRYIYYNFAKDYGLSNMNFFKFTGNGTTVDMDHININAANELTPPVFTAGNTALKLFAYIGSEAALHYDFSATDAGPSDVVTYRIANAPEGAVFNTSTGTWEWKPTQAGTYAFVVEASDGTVVSTRDVTVTVANNRQSAVDAVIATYDANTDYIWATHDTYKQVYNDTMSIINTASDAEFYQKLAALHGAVQGLQLTTPLLADGSINYQGMFLSSDFNPKIFLDNNSGSFGNTSTNFGVYMDMGPSFRVSASAFQIQARAGFPARGGGMTMFGSNDKETWTRLTPGETPVSAAMHTLAVSPELRNEQFRFLKIQMVNIASDAYFPELSEFRIFGKRHEVINKLAAVSIGSDQVFGGRIITGDTAKLTFQSTEAIKNVNATIQGQPATVHSVDGLNWTAEAVMKPGTTSGDVTFKLHYQTANGIDAPETLFTTDGSKLFYADDSDLITNVTSLANLIDSTVRSAADTLIQVNNLFDNNASTSSDFRLNGSGAESYITFDFKEGNRVKLTNVELLARQDQVARINGAVVQGSNDNTTWTNLTKAAVSTADWQMLKVNDSIGYRYIRITNAIGWFGNMAELRLHGNITVSIEDLMADAESQQASGYTKASFYLYSQEISRIQAEMGKPGYDEALLINEIKKAKSLLVSYETLLKKIPVQPEMVRASEKYLGNDSITEAQNGWRGFDGSTATFIHTRSATSWVDVDFGAGNEKSIEAFRFSPRSTHLTRASGTVFRGSNDGATWVDLYKIPGVAEYQWYIANNPDKTPYRYIRIYDNHTGYMNFEEIEFMERGVDKTLLTLLIDKAETVQTAGIYSAESLQSLQEVVTASKLVVQKANATQDEVNAAENSMQAALGALQYLQGMPVLVGLADLMVTAEQPMTFTIHATNAVTEVVYGVSGGLPIGASFNPATRTFTWIPALDQGGVYPVTFTAAAGGLSSSKTINITVKGQPVFNPAGTVEVTARKSLTHPVVATDPIGETLVYSASGLPVGAKLDAMTGVFTWTPNQADYGTNPVTFTVSNGKFAVSRTVNFKVTLDIHPAQDYTRASYDSYNREVTRISGELLQPGADKTQLLADLAQAEALLVQVPVSLYSFEGNADNSIGSTHGTVSGTQTYSAGKFGQAVDLNGTDSYVQLPAKHPFSGYNEITVSSWVFWRGGSAWQRIFDFGNNTNQYMFLSPSVNTNKLRFAIKNGGGEQMVETTKLATNQWVHVAVTLGGGTAKLYVNGQLAATNNNVTIKPSDFKPSVNYIGKSMYPDPLFNGKIDEFRIYNYALSAEEILAEKNSSTSRWTDKTLLTQLLSEAAAVEAGRYTPSSAADLQTAVIGAQQVQSNSDATQQQIDSSTDALKAAIEGLMEMGVRLTGPVSVVGGQLLDLTYSLMNVTSSVYAKMVTFNYDPALLQYVGMDSLPENFTVVGSTYGNGQIKVIEAGLNSPVTGSVSLLKLRFLTVTPDQTVTSSVYMSDVVIADQNGAETSLYVGPAYNVEIVKVEKAALYGVIQSANVLLESSYKPSTWSIFAEKRSVAESVYGNPASTQAEVNVAATGLQTAMNGLQLRADGSALAAQIAEAEAVALAAQIHERLYGHYPQASVTALNQAIALAKTAAGNLEADQSDIDLAREGLATALETFRESVNTGMRIGDLGKLAAHYGETSTDSQWMQISMYDFNKDGKLGLYDLSYLAKHLIN
jgi:hypothetical protein